MKVSIPRRLLMLLPGVFLVACDDSEVNRPTAPASVAEAAANPSASNPAWDEKLATVATMMKAQRESKDLIGFVRDAAVNADTVYPYLESVMAGDSLEDRKSASLLLFTAGYMLVTNGHVDVPSKARDYIDSLEGGSKPAEKLLDNQDLVPTYENYRNTIDK